MEQSHGETLSTQEIYRRLNPSVVTVMAQVEDGMSVGTGVIFTEDGYILTNYHVLEGGSSCTVTPAMTAPMRPFTWPGMQTTIWRS